MSRPTRPSTRPLRYRRSPRLVSYWEGKTLILHDYQAGRRVEAAPLVIDVLDAFDTWRPAAHAASRVPGVPPADLERLVVALADAGVLERAVGRRAKPDDDGWAPWLPAAGFFHSATRDVSFWPRDDANAFLARKADRTPPPPPLTQSTALAHAFIALPAPALRGELHDTLRARRTWRRFGREPLALDTLSELLGLTWGVQAWIDVPHFGRIPLKTSPSGGARHSIEAYVVIRNVDGAPPGVYHYDSAAHALAPVGGPVPTKTLHAFVAQQTWMARAAALVFMTAVFARVQWRYPSPRAYRTVIAEAGHHAQTFCLLATARGLAPFCTMALADTAVERALGVDGTREAVMYAVGVGARPGRTAWAPWPGRRDTPRRRDVVPGVDAPPPPIRSHV